jgi:aminobenzoyl-glutamate utilization protein B
LRFSLDTVRAPEVRMRTLAPVLVPLLLAVPVAAEERPTDAYLAQTRDRWNTVAKRVWDAPETAFGEKRSSAALAEALKQEGFKVVWGAGGGETAFVATAGSGAPIVGLLAEYDALPGLSQVAGQTRQSPVVQDGAGHGCGHNLLGTASVAAAVAANRERQARTLPGTIQLFGTPAEEAGVGKTFMIRDGAFKATDVVLAWHPDDRNRVANRARLAVTVTDVQFFGRSAMPQAPPGPGGAHSTRWFSSTMRCRSCASTSCRPPVSTG